MAFDLEEILTKMLAPVLELARMLGQLLRSKREKLNLELYMPLVEQQLGHQLALELSEEKLEALALGLERMLGKLLMKPRVPLLLAPLSLVQELLALVLILMHILDRGLLTLLQLDDLHFQLL